VTRAFLLLILAAGADAGVHAVLRRPVEIKADEFTAFNTRQRAEWTGHVRVKRDETRITCQRLDALWAGDQDVTDIRCDGDVEATDGDKRVKGQHADFDNETGILVVTPSPDGGTVEIWDGKTHLWGTKAIFRSGENKLQVDNPTTIIKSGTKPELPAPRKDAGR
jgi:lipopolysaccharide assembly outer membrane protein LptD (OstA)